MSRSSELVELAKLNGDFKQNYGKLFGAYLYLSSINASRGRLFGWRGLWLAVLSIGASWLLETAFPHLQIPFAKWVAHLRGLY